MRTLLLALVLAGCGKPHPTCGGDPDGGATTQMCPNNLKVTCPADKPVTVCVHENKNPVGSVKCCKDLSCVFFPIGLPEATCE